jgi:hypothetical protein
MAPALFLSEDIMKLPQSATVTPEFVDLMIDIYKTWLEAVMANSREFGMAGKSAINVKRILPIVRRQSPDLHTGLDYEITRLRGSHYSKFTTCELKGVRFLVGITRHITMIDYQERESGSNKPCGEMGSYRVFLSDQMFARADMRQIHMIPERNPRSVFRHPHHYVAVSQRDFDANGKAFIQKSVSPLFADTGNCWGSVSNPAKNAIDDPDIPELFRLLGYHLSTRGNGPPVKDWELDFDHTTPEAK